MLKKIFALVLASIMLLGAVSAFAAEDLPRNETMYFGGQQWGPINGWNPLSSNMNNSMALAAAPRGSREIMFETLYMYNMLDGQLYPLLADGDYVWNDDLTEMTVKIKAAAKDLGYAAKNLAVDTKNLELADQLSLSDVIRLVDELCIRHKH